MVCGRVQARDGKVYLKSMNAEFLDNGRCDTLQVTGGSNRATGTGESGPHPTSRVVSDLIARFKEWDKVRA